MNPTVTASQVLHVIQQLNPFFTRKSLYEAIESGLLKADRNPVAKKGQYRFQLDEVDRYTSEQLKWPRFKALDLLRAQK